MGLTNPELEVLARVRVELLELFLQSDGKVDHDFRIFDRFGLQLLSADFIDVFAGSWFA
jgi:hypothetical protein